MKFFVNLFEFRIRHMGIYLRGRDRSMSEKFLDSSNIRTVGEEGSGETMSECMSGNLFYDIGPESIVFNLIGDEKSRKSHIRIRQRFFYNIISLYWLWIDIISTEIMSDKKGIEYIFFAEFGFSGF